MYCSKETDVLGMDEFDFIKDNKKYYLLVFKIKQDNYESYLEEKTIKEIYDICIKYTFDGIILDKNTSQYEYDDNLIIKIKTKDISSLLKNILIK